MFITTKVREGNVFTDVCLSVHRVGVPTRPLTVVRLYFKLQGPPGPHSDTGHGDPPAPALSCLQGIYGGHRLRPIQTCSLDPNVQEKYCPHQYWHLVAIKVLMVGKQVVCIELECLLVVKYFYKMYENVRDRISIMIGI